jgi:putative addiction module component (TIGR02574 family)
MVRNELIQEILQLDTLHREYIRDVILASLSDEPSQLSPDEQAELQRRIEAYDKNPEGYLTWEQVKEKLAEQRARRGR